MSITLKTLDQFRTFFDAELSRDLMEMENIRLELAGRVVKLNKTFGFTLIALALFTAFSIAGAFYLAEWLFFFSVPTIFVIVGFLIAWAIRYTKMTKNYAPEFKQKVISRIIRFIDPNLQYEPEKMVGPEEYQASGLFRSRPDRYKGDDLVHGTLGGTAVRFSELHTQYKRETRDSKGNRKVEYHTIFKGLFFIAEFNKNFKGETYVLPDLAQKAFGNVVGNLFQSWNKGRGQLVRMEDPEFEKNFVVYGTNQIEPRYILSTSLMDRINRFKNRVNRELYLSFINNRVYVAISYYKDLFEPRLFKSLLDFNVTQAYYEDLMLAAGIVEELNLNTRIWSR